MSQIAPEFVELQRARHEHPELYRGYPTGFRGLDEKIGSWLRDDYVVAGGMSGQGKTTFLITEAYSLAHMGVRWAWFGLEEEDIATVGRLFSIEGNIPRKMFRDIGLTPNEWPRVFETSEKLSQFECWFYYGARDMEELYEVVATLDVNCVILDYVQLMRGARIASKNNTRTQEVSEISGGLQRLKRSDGQSLLKLAAAQLNKEEGWLWSEDLLRDSDVALKIKDSLDTYGKAQENLRDLEVAKCRHGSEGIVTVGFNGEIGRFEDVNVRIVDATAEVARLNAQPFKPNGLPVQYEK